MKEKTILIVLGVLLLIGIGYWFLIGRGDRVETVSVSELKAAYEKMHMETDEVESYILELRILGTVDEERFNERVRFRNYMNEKIEVTVRYETTPERGQGRDRDRDAEEVINEEIYYLVDDVVYAENEEGEYEKKLTPFRYRDVNIYLTALVNLKESVDYEIETMGADEFYLYDVLVAKEAVQDILDSVLIDYEIKEDVETTIYLDDEGRVYRIVYETEDLKIYAFYAAINKIPDFTLPLMLGE